MANVSKINVNNVEYTIKDASALSSVSFSGSTLSVEMRNGQSASYDILSDVYQTIEDNEEVVASALSKHNQVMGLDPNGNLVWSQESGIDASSLREGIEQIAGSMIDEKVKQEAGSGNQFYPVLSAPNSAPSGVQTTSSMYQAGLKVNPSTGAMTVGFGNQALGTGSVAMGEGVVAEGRDSVAFGYKEDVNSSIWTSANGTMAHGQTSGSGSYIVASGDGATAHGYTMGSGSYIEASGAGAIAHGHTMGSGSYIEASADGATAQGYVEDDNSCIEAYGSGSFASGRSVHVYNISEHAEGSFNVTHSDDPDIYGLSDNTQHSIGIGTSEQDRKNAVEIMQNGDIYIYGMGDYNGSNYSAATRLQDLIPEQVELLTQTEIDKIISDGGPGGKVSVLYIDDFPDNKLEEILSDWGAENLQEIGQITATDEETAISMGTNLYYPNGEQIEYEGETYDVWIGYVQGDAETGAEIGYAGIISSETSLDEMVANSLYSGSDNRYCPFVALFSTNDIGGEPYRDTDLGESDTLIYAK